VEELNSNAVIVNPPHVLWPTLTDAKYIWATTDGNSLVDTLDEFGPWTFTKSLDIPSGYEDCTGSIKMTADNTYKLYVNGVFLGEDGDLTTVETYALSELQTGTNEIKIVAVNLEPERVDHYTNPAMVLFRADITCAGVHDSNPPPPPAGNTPVGQNVEADVGDGVTVVFDEVTQAGDTTVETTTTNPGPEIVGHKAGFFQDLSSTAKRIGGALVRIVVGNVPDLSESTGSLLNIAIRTGTAKLFHLVSGSGGSGSSGEGGVNPTPVDPSLGIWEDVTQQLHPGEYTIEGYTPSFSWFAVVYEPWEIRGFNSPVDMGTEENPILNTIQSGRSVALKFEVFVGEHEMTSTDQEEGIISSFAQKRISCTTLDDPTTDAVEITNTGGTELRYDQSAGQYIANWKTPSNAAGQCYEVKVTTLDGSEKTAYFQLTR